MTVQELGSRMTQAEFLRWMDYDIQKPHTDAWEQTALLCSIYASTFAAKNSRIKPSDFLPPKVSHFDPPSPEAFRIKFASFRDRHNAAVLARGG